MKEAIGDIFSQPDADAICFTSNGVVKANGELVMGAGIAKAFYKRYGRDLALDIGEQVKKYGNTVHLSKYIGMNTAAGLGSERYYNLLSFPTKNHWQDPADLALIKQSAIRLAEFTVMRGWKHVYLTRPGCGLGGLNWETQVKPLISPILDDRFTVLTPK